MSEARAALTLVSWNVRHCRGHDRRISARRILSVLESVDPDLVALQEVDVERVRSHGLDQPGWLAERLSMQHVFCETTPRYGHALLTRLPIDRVERVTLPTLAASEPRAAIDLTVRAPARVRVVSTHLSLSAPDRTAQARSIATRIDPAREPTVVLGDLNAGPRELGYADLVPALRDPFAPLALGARCTWPAIWPVRALDHVLVSPALRIGRAVVLHRGAARFASDHRPVVVSVHVATSASGHVDC